MIRLLLSSIVLGVFVVWAIEKRNDLRFFSPLIAFFISHLSIYQLAKGQSKFYLLLFIPSIFLAFLQIVQSLSLIGNPLVALAVGIAQSF